MVSEEWIATLNKELRAANIDPRQRPWEAIRRYCKEFDTSINLSSDMAKSIFDWFVAHSKFGVHQIGSLYETVYFYDGQFWVVSIPFQFGMFQLNALDCLHEMPEGIKHEMMADNDQALDYAMYWEQCIHYGKGLNELRETQGANEFGIQLLMSADQELRVAQSVLSQNRAEPRAILNCRMALEMFFKSYIALKNGLTENEAKAIGHDLGKGLEQFIEVSGLNGWEWAKEQLKVFPKIHERYREQDISFQKLWNGYLLAQTIGAVIAKEFTCRNKLGPAA